MRAALPLLGLLLLGACAPPIAQVTNNRHGTTDDEDTSSGDNTAASDTTPSNPTATATTQTLTVTITGTGTVASVPGSLTCQGQTCTGAFAPGTKATLTAAPGTGLVFLGWGGACTGAASCQPTINAATAITAEFGTVDGTWTGNYDHHQSANNCSFDNVGTITTTLQTSGTTINATNNNFTGFQLKNTGNCALVNAGAPGTAPTTPLGSAPTLTGQWTVSIQGASGALPLPFSATVAGKTMTGTWTCTGCTGSFTLTKQ